tara:strand:+ start:1506 stop:2252 length:747 start_codon:yes stop_codon:yes gene_type:complete
MAYNNISGSVLLPNELLKVEGISSGIVSGNLSTSDGAEVINVPRVANATNNSIITNVGGNANTLTCETNLTFDGDTLGITGEITASTGISASFFMGDGSRLTGISGGGGGNANAQGPLGALQFRNDADAGTISGSVNIIFNNNILQLAGGLKLNRRNVSSTVTASLTDYYIGTNTTNGILSIRLPDAANLLNGQTYVVKDEAGTANSNNVTILASGSQTIDGQNSVILESPFASIQLYCNGTNKYFIY